MDVSCKPILDIVRFLDKRGIPADKVLQGTSNLDSVTLAELENPDGLLTWLKASAVYQRAEHYISSRPDIEEFIDFIFSGSGAVMPHFARIIGAISSVQTLYNVLFELAGRRNFPVVEMEYNLKTTPYRMTIRFPEDGYSATLLLKLVQRMWEVAPQRIGLGQAIVDAEISGNFAMYAITPPPGGGFVYRLWRHVKAIFSANPIIKELVDFEMAVQRKLDTLSETRASLERNLDARARELKTINQKLSNKMRDLDEIEKISGTGTWTLDRTSGYATMSENAVRILGLEPLDTQLRQEQLVASIHPEDRKEYKIAIERLSADKPDFYLEHRVHKENETRLIQQKGRLVSEGNSQVIIGSILDVTNLRGNEMRLAREKELALEASRNKSQFLASMSHEIRTPMTSVLGFAELINNPKTPAEKVPSYVETILRNGRLLLGLIDEILDLSKVESGLLRFNVIRSKTAQMLQQTFESVQQEANRKECKLELLVSSEIPDEFPTDPQRFAQIISSVTNTAMRGFGATELKISVVPFKTSDGKSVGIAVEVVDVANSINPDFYKLLLRPYAAFEMDKRKGRTVAGLTFAVARALVTAMNGEFTVSEENRSLAVAFRPSATTEPSSPLENYSIPINILLEGPLLKNRNILIVEDNKDIQEILAKLVRDAGASIDIANNGVECLKKAESTTYDMMIMDLQMPVMDGFETIERLRTGGYTRPIIVVTAYALNNERERCLKVGATDFVTKPISSEVLLRTLVRHR